MADARTVKNCRWAEPTIFAPFPQWMANEEYPWTCHADGKPRSVQNPEVCEDCPRWTANRGQARFEDRRD
jgi:hypothetical protein